MKKSLFRGKSTISRWIFAVAMLAAFGLADASAQGSYSVGQLSRASRQRQQNRQNPYGSVYEYQTAPHEHSYGTFFAEYNRMTMDIDNSLVSNPGYNGISVGFDYFLPFAGGLGVDLGAKVQYFFRNEEEGILTYKDNLLSGTVPVRLAYDWRISDSFALMPFAGVYGRYNFSGKQVYEESGVSGRTSINQFDEKQTSYYGIEKLKRLQAGWEAGARAVISETFSVGASYWMDFTEIGHDTKLKGFSIMLGANF